MTHGTSHDGVAGRPATVRCGTPSDGGQLVAVGAVDRPAPAPAPGPTCGAAPAAVDDLGMVDAQAAAWPANSIVITPSSNHGP